MAKFHGKVGKRMSVLSQLKEEQLFTSAEQEVVRAILQCPRAVIDATIGEFAKSVYSSPSTVGRVCKKLGLSGFSELKIRLATELDRLIENKEAVDVMLPIRKEDKVRDFPQILFNLHHQALLSAYHSVDIRMVQKVADVLYRADYVYVLGSQQSLILAQDFLCKAAKLGFPFVNPFMAGFNNNLYCQRKAKTQAALIISQYAASRKVERWVEDLKHIKSEICLITANAKSPVIWKVNYAVIIDNEEEIVGKMGNFASRTGLSYVLDILYMVLFMKDYDKNLENIQINLRERERPDW